MLAWLSVARYQAYNIGMYDLGNMAQAIWSASQGEPLLYSRPEGMRASRLAGHVELGYLLLAIPYRLWSDPRLLLVIQAGLFASAAVPAYRIGLRHTGTKQIGRAAALVWLLYPTNLTAVLFDLHGDTLAAPLLLFALDALDGGRLRRFAIFAVLACSFKFYVAVVVAALGLLLVWRGRRRLGLLTAALALGYAMIAFVLIRPIFPDAGRETTGSAAEYIGYYFGQWNLIAATLPARILTALVVLGPAMLVARHGAHWLLPVLPLAAAALVSTGPGGASDYRYHHFALVGPFVVLAFAAGAATMQQRAAQPQRRARNWQADVGFGAAIVALCGALLVDTPLNPLFWIGGPGRGFDAAAYGRTSRDALKDAWLPLAATSDDAIIASNFLTPHLVNRTTLYVARYAFDPPSSDRLQQLLPQADVVLTDALFDYYLPLGAGYAGGVDGERAQIAALLRDPAWLLTDARDGLLRFARAGAPDAPEALTSTFQLRPDDRAPAQAVFGGAELVRASMIQTGVRHLRATFVWRRGTDALATRRALAVSHFDGLPDARVVHLPTYALLPRTEWPADQIVEETFDILLPPDTPPGSYTVTTGWYAIGLPASQYTDARTALGEARSLTVVVR